MVAAVASVGVCERTRVEEATPSNTVVNFILKVGYDGGCRLEEFVMREEDTALQSNSGKKDVAVVRRMGTVNLKLAWC